MLAGYKGVKCAVKADKKDFLKLFFLLKFPKIKSNLGNSGRLHAKYERLHGRERESSNHSVNGSERDLNDFMWKSTIRETSLGSWGMFTCSGFALGRDADLDTD